MRLLMFRVSEMKQAQFVGSSGHTELYRLRDVFFHSHLCADVKIV